MLKDASWFPRWYTLVYIKVRKVNTYMVSDTAVRANGHREGKKIV